MKTKKLYVSRHTHGKRAANKIRKQFADLGATHLTIASVTRGSYLVRGRIDIVKFARFCANEAREQSKPTTEAR